MVRKPLAKAGRYKRRRFSPRVGKMPCRRAWQPTPGFLLGEPHGQRSLMGYSPWVSKSRTQSERLSTHTYPSNHRVGQKSPESSLVPLSSQHPPHLERWLLAPPSHRRASPALHLHTNRIRVCSLLCLLPPSFTQHNVY